MSLTDWRDRVSDARAPADWATEWETELIIVLMTGGDDLVPLGDGQWPTISVCLPNTSTLLLFN